MELNIIEDDDTTETTFIEETDTQADVITIEEIVTPASASMIETCVELKNIQYKTMLLKGVPSVAPRFLRTTDNINNLDRFLEDEKNSNINDSWSNLDKMLKMKKLVAYADAYKVEHVLSEEEHKSMLKFLKESLDHKKLQRVKDVVYDKATGLIKSIPALNYCKATSHFTLKNVDKRVSTMKSLPPKKNRGTVKHSDTGRSDAGRSVLHDLEATL